MKGSDADIHGEGINLEAQGSEPNIGFWDQSDDRASWKTRFAEPGAYRMRVAPFANGLRNPSTGGSRTVRFMAFC